MAKPQQTQSWPYKPIYPPHQQYSLPYRHPSLCQETCFRSNGSSAPPMAYHRHHQQLHRTHPLPQLPYPTPPPSGMPYGGQDNPYMRRKPSQIPAYMQGDHYLPQQSGSSLVQPQQIIHRPIPQNRYDYSDYYRLNQQSHHPTGFHHMPPPHHHAPYQPPRQSPSATLPQSNHSLVNQSNAPPELASSPAASTQYPTSNSSFNAQQDPSLNNIDVRQFLSTWQDMDEEVSDTPSQPTFNKSLYVQPLDCTKRPDLYNVQNNSYFEKPHRSNSQGQPYQQSYMTSPLEALSNAVESHPVLDSNMNLDTSQHVDRALNYMPCERRIEKICNPSLAYNNQYSIDEQFVGSDGYQHLKPNTDKSQYHLTASLESSDLFDDINRKKEEKQKNVVHPMRYDDVNFIRYAPKKPDVPLVSVRPNMQFIENELGSEGNDHFIESGIAPKLKLLESCQYSNETNHLPSVLKEPSPLRCSSPFQLPCESDGKTSKADTIAMSLPLLNFDSEDMNIDEDKEANQISEITGFQNEDSAKNEASVKPQDSPIPTIDSAPEEMPSFDNAEYCCIHFGLPRRNSGDIMNKASVSRKDKLFVFKVKRLLLRIKKNLNSEKNLLNLWKAKNGLPLLGKKSQPRSKISAAHLCKRLEEVNRFLLLKKRYAKRKKLRPFQTTYSFSNDSGEVEKVEETLPISEIIPERDSIEDFDQSTIDIQLIGAEEVELSESEGKEMSDLNGGEDDVKNNHEKESLKCSLPWHKIFKNQPKLSGCKESLVLGPAKVKFSSPRTQTNAIQWKIVEPQRTSNLPSSIVSVKRLIVKHNIFEEKVPKMVIKKTEGKEYKSFIKNNETCSECCDQVPSDQPVKLPGEEEEDPVKTVHHCLLCHESFSHLDGLESHEKSDHHRSLDLIQRNALYQVKKFIDEGKFPSVEPLSESEMKFLYWKPDYPGFKHVYHNAPF